MTDTQDWIHELRAALPNHEVEVVVNSPSGEEAKRKIRNEVVAYTNTLHPRTRQLVKSGFVSVRRLGDDEIDALSRSPEEDEDSSDEDVGVPTVEVDEPTLVPTGEEDTPPEVVSPVARYFTEEELSSLKKAELVSLCDLNPDLGIDTKQNKDQLLEDMLECDIPWIDTELLEG